MHQTLTKIESEVEWRGRTTLVTEIFDKMQFPNKYSNKGKKFWRIFRENFISVKIQKNLVVNYTESHVQLDALFCTQCDTTNKETPQTFPTDSYFHVSNTFVKIEAEHPQWSDYHCYVIFFPFVLCHILYIRLYSNIIYSEIY